MAALQRPHRGSRVSVFYPVKSLPPLSSLDSAFQLQEYISLLIRLDVHDVDAIVSLPGKATQDEPTDTLELDARKPEDADRKGDISVDRACWIYEQLRRLAQDLSHPLVTMLQQECTRSSCPQMKAGEWLYLCVAHGNDGAMEQCCAIDYILHTVDSATALLNSPRAFPSRLSIPHTSHRHFASLARRLGRIFAHAYFHHREAFEQAEAESSLYARFLKLTNLFDLVPAEFLVIPESAIHHDDKSQPEEVEPPRLFSAAVHPTPNFQNDTLTTTTVPDNDQVSVSRPRSADTSTQYGTDSPRKLGRSRTDTMVFSEAFTVAEDLSRTGDSNDLPGSSPVAETQSLASGQSWTDLQIRTEGLDDEDIGDARSELTLTGLLSPPVETLSLISLEDSADVTTSHETTLHDAPSEPSLPSPRSKIQVIETADEHLQGAGVPRESAAADEVDEASPSVVVDVALEGATAATFEAMTETIQAPPVPEQRAGGLTSETDGPIGLPSEVSKGPELQTESEAAAAPEQSLELTEPSPSEPIPPESESDITDEVGGHDGDEVRGSGEEEAVVE